MSTSVKVDLSGLERRFGDAARESRLAEATDRAGFMMTKYVPLDKGPLRASESTNSQFRAGRLVWNTPYAAAQYYRPMRHTQPGTTDHWCDAFKQKDMGKLVSYVEAMYRG